MNSEGTLVLTQSAIGEIKTLIPKSRGEVRMHRGRHETPSNQNH